MRKTTLFSLLTMLVMITGISIAQPTVDGRLTPSDSYGAAYKVYNTSSVKGTLYKTEDASYFYFGWQTSRGFNDNVYSSNNNDVGYAGWGSHEFKDLRNSDHIVFKLKKTGGTTVVDVDLDYLYYASPVWKSGLGSGNYYDGANRIGGSHIVAHKTSLEYNINSSGWTNWLTKSPTPESSYPNWVYPIIYEFKISKACLGGGSFSDADVYDSHNSPPKNSGFPDFSMDDDVTICVQRPGSYVLSIAVKNVGGQNMTTTRVDLDYPQYITYSSSSIPPKTGTTDIFELGTITPGQTKSFTVTVNVGASYPDQFITIKGVTLADSPGCGDLSVEAKVETEVCNPLPVELVSFSASVVKKSVALKWRTATEMNNHGFEVQRLEKNAWIKIGFVDGHGTVNTPQDYSFNDENIGNTGSTFTYRLKQIDRDGTFDYSPQIEASFRVTRREFGIIGAYPNPFNPSTMIQFYLPTEQTITVTLFNALGAEVKTILNDAVMPMGVHSTMIDGKNLASGSYWIVLTAGEQKSNFKISLVR